MQIFAFSRSARDDDDEKYYCAPGFVYCFPFLEWVLKSRLGGDDKFETVAGQALQVISEHMVMRGADENDLFHPRFLPIKQLLSLIIHVISKSIFVSLNKTVLKDFFQVYVIYSSIYSLYINATRKSILGLDVSVEDIKRMIWG